MNARKAHNTGRNHVANVRDYFASLGHDTAQNIIDAIIQQHETGGRAQMLAAPSMRLGAGFMNPMAPPMSKWQPVEDRVSLTSYTTRLLRRLSSVPCDRWYGWWRRTVPTSIRSTTFSSTFPIERVSPPTIPTFRSPLFESNAKRYALLPHPAAVPIVCCECSAAQLHTCSRSAPGRESRDSSGSNEDDGQIEWSWGAKLLPVLFQGFWNVSRSGCNTLMDACDVYAI